MNKNKDDFICVNNKTFKKIAEVNKVSGIIERVEKLKEDDFTFRICKENKFFKKQSGSFFEKILNLKKNETTNGTIYKYEQILNLFNADFKDVKENENLLVFLFEIFKFPYIFDIIENKKYNFNNFEPLKDDINIMNPGYCCVDIAIFNLLFHNKKWINSSNELFKNEIKYDFENVIKKINEGENLIFTDFIYLERLIVHNRIEQFIKEINECKYKNNSCIVEKYFQVVTEDKMFYPYQEYIDIKASSYPDVSLESAIVFFGLDIINGNYDKLSVADGYTYVMTNLNYLFNYSHRKKNFDRKFFSIYDNSLIIISQKYKDFFKTITNDKTQYIAVTNNSLCWRHCFAISSKNNNGYYNIYSSSKNPKFIDNLNTCHSLSYNYIINESKENNFAENSNDNYVFKQYVNLIANIRGIIPMIDQINDSKIQKNLILDLFEYCHFINIYVDYEKFLNEGIREDFIKICKIFENSKSFWKIFFGVDNFDNFEIRKNIINTKLDNDYKKLIDLKSNIKNYFIKEDIKAKIKAISDEFIIFRDEISLNDEILNTYPKQYNNIFYIKNNNLYINPIYSNCYINENNDRIFYKGKYINKSEIITVEEKSDCIIIPFRYFNFYTIKPVEYMNELIKEYLKYDYKRDLYLLIDGKLSHMLLKINNYNFFSTPQLVCYLRKNYNEFDSILRDDKWNENFYPKFNHISYNENSYKFLYKYYPNSNVIGEFYISKKNNILNIKNTITKENDKNFNFERQISLNINNNFNYNILGVLNDFKNLDFNCFNVKIWEDLFRRYAKFFKIDYNYDSLINNVWFQDIYNCFINGEYSLVFYKLKSDENNYTYLDFGYYDHNNKYYVLHKANDQIERLNIFSWPNLFKSEIINEKNNPLYSVIYNSELGKTRYFDNNTLEIKNDKKEVIKKVNNLNELKLEEDKILEEYLNSLNNNENNNSNNDINKNNITNNNNNK